jgi:cobyrinic acid a,c-diamide synthase
MKPQILISAPAAGSGKTLFAMGLLRVLKKRGFKVQPYKCGPDFIDSQYLSISADCDSVNLDAWMSSNTHVQHIYNRYGEQADVCVTEGVGGLFDGYRRMQGSTAEMAGLLNLPVVLLVNARIAGYSVAPLIYGFKNFYSGIHIAGVVFNKVSSSAHYSYLREACADANVDCLGYLSNMEEFKLPSKHSAVSVASRRSLDELANAVAVQIEKTVDVNRLLSRCSRNFPCPYTLPYCSDNDFDAFQAPLRKIKIAIARDPAFCFTYRENIAQLARIGEITHFSPLYGYELPEADLVYLPGGYPELFARQLHRRHKMMDSLKEYAERGGKILAECGGMVFLGRTLKSKENGTAYAMSNILPIDFVMPGVPKLQTGYRKLSSPDWDLKGAEFHYSTILKDDTSGTDWRTASVTNWKGLENDTCFYRYKNVIASYTHWYWGDKDMLKLWQ